MKTTGLKKQVTWLYQKLCEIYIKLAIIGVKGVSGQGELQTLKSM